MVITKYLVFDLEYASQADGESKICEFGYVVTNEKFEILKKGNFIINPYITDRDWNYRVLKTILTRKKWVYEKSPRFDYYYDEIYDLIATSDYVFGHSLDGDAKSLNDECKRYDLPSIDFDFYDIKQFYKDYVNTKRDVSVTEILEKLGITGDEKTHDAEADAYNTMLELEGMLDKLELTLDDLISLCPNAKNRNEYYMVESIVKNQRNREEKLKNELNDEGDNSLRKYSKHGRMFLQFLDNVQPTKEIDKKLQGLKFSISINYAEKHYKQMLNIVQLLCNLGATYILKASLSDIFVKYDVYNEDGTIRYCSKAKFVEEANNNGANIKTISFDELMNMLEITENELNDMPMPSFDCLYREDAVIKDRKTLKALNKRLSDRSQADAANSESCLGDLFKDFFDDFKNDKKDE